MHFMIFSFHCFTSGDSCNLSCVLVPQSSSWTDAQRYTSSSSTYSLNINSADMLLHEVPSQNIQEPVRLCTTLTITAALQKAQDICQH